MRMINVVKISFNQHQLSSSYLNCIEDLTSFISNKSGDICLRSVPIQSLPFNHVAQPQFITNLCMSVLLLDCITKRIGIYLDWSLSFLATRQLWLPSHHYIPITHQPIVTRPVLHNSNSAQYILSGNLTSSYKYSVFWMNWAMMTIVSGCTLWITEWTFV